MGLGDVLFAPCFAFLAGHPFWLFFLNAAYMLALAVTFITRKRGETLKKKPIPMGVYFSIALFFTFIAKILFYIYGLDNFVEVPDES
ncbi:peptidase, A24 type IV prepilin peptidase family protein [Leptospira ryugenii]|uniref:Peptidase, A24 type IV prepilin peptidase family protein n=2 Tax=Leptospira ryugenii TaxID=1917863 RepID=A0A2P2DY11_9LEPT|nr:peptidase, A24 type IV prepilin peptidase family protein [Leptospira ryugenii]